MFIYLVFTLTETLPIIALFCDFVETFTLFEFDHGFKPDLIGRLLGS